MYFCNFVIISFWKSIDTFMFINLNSLHPKITCWNWPSGSWEEVFLKFMTECLLFHNYLPLEKVLACHLNKLEPPSPKNALCHVWSKLAQWFWRIRFLNLSMYSRYFVSMSPLKRIGPSFTKGRKSKRRRKRWRRRNLREFCVLLNVEPYVLAYIFTSDSTCDDRVFRDRNQPLDTLDDVDLISRYRFPRRVILQFVDGVDTNIRPFTYRSLTPFQHKYR